MSHPALTIIRDEHGALSAMLRSLSMLLAEHRRHGSLPDFSVLRAMLFYVDEFPEQLHHTKESEFLFPRVRACAPELAPTLDRLEQDHARGERAIRELEHRLLAFEVLGEPRRAAFEEALQAYSRAYLEHMAAVTFTRKAAAELRGRFQIALEACLKLSREGVVIMPVSPPWYANPAGLDDLVAGFSRKILALLGEDAGPGWREDELE